MPRIPNTPVVLSEDSYTILNGIRNTIGGEFREATPLVEDAESLAAYGEVVMGSGHYRNQYIGLIGKIAQQILLHYAYENPLKLLKRGVLEIGESVEIDWVRLTMPEGYSQSVANPGDVFKTNNPEVLFTWHPVNSQLFYETTVNEQEISLCFTNQNGVNDLIGVIIQRIYDSSEWDEQIIMQYLLARAYLDNKSKLAIQIPSVIKANADDIVIAEKKVSNDMRFMNSGYNIAGEPTHTPVDKQVFVISSDMSAVVDVGSLAKAFNLEYNKFIGRSIMVDGFSFNADKIARLDHIMQITKAQGLIPNYTPFTDEELAELEMVQGCIMDERFLVIYDRLVEMRDVIDARHLNVNYYYHLWKIFSYNVFAQCRFFTTEELTPPTPPTPETDPSIDKIQYAEETGPDTYEWVDVDEYGVVSIPGVALKMRIVGENYDSLAVASDNVNIVFSAVDSETGEFTATVSNAVVSSATITATATKGTKTATKTAGYRCIPALAFKSGASVQSFATALNALDAADETVDVADYIDADHCTPTGGDVVAQLAQGATGLTAENGVFTCTGSGTGQAYFGYSVDGVANLKRVNYTITVG